MNYKPLPGADPKDAPRYLTDKEIEDIVDALPQNPQAEPRNAFYIHEFIKDKYRKALRREKLCPSMIGACKTRIIEDHFKAVTEAGRGVGNRLAANISGISMQTTLSNFQSAGQGTFNSTSTIESLQTLIMARINVRNPVCYTGFKKRMSMKEFLMYAPSLIGTTVASIIVSRSILPLSEVGDEWWSNRDTIQKIYGIALPTPTLVLRLHLNVREMYKQSLSIGHVARVISSLDDVVAIHSPQSQGIIDCYRGPNSKLDNVDISEDLEDTLYYRSILLPQLKEQYVKGIQDITAVYPMRYRLWNVVSTERISNDADKERIKQYDYKSFKGELFTIVLSPSRMTTNYITVDDVLSAVFEYTPAQRLWSSEDNLMHIYLMNEYDEEGNPISPGVYLENSVNEGMKQYAEELRQVGDGSIPDAPQIISDYHILRCVAQGANLIHLMMHPMIDPNSTYCNSIHVTNSVLGIEAAHTVFMRELMAILTGINSNFAVAHVQLLADLIFSKGYPYGATSIGVSRRGGGFLTLSSNDGYKKNLSTSAMLGNTEQSGSFTFSMVSGQPANDGVGRFVLVHTVKEADGRTRQLIDEDCWRYYQHLILKGEKPREDTDEAQPDSQRVQEPIAAPSTLSIVELGASEAAAFNSDIVAALKRIREGVNRVIVAKPAPQGPKNDLVVPEL